METAEKLKPWERLRELLGEDDPGSLVNFLDTLSPDETVRAVFRLLPEEQMRLLTALPPDSAAELIDEVPDVHAADLLDELRPQDAASIVGELDSDQAADVLGELDEEDYEEILDYMDPDDAAEARLLISYPGDSAGGLMMTEYLAYKGVTRVGEVIADISSRTDDFPLYHLQQIFVIRPSGRLRGAVNLNDIAFADPSRQLGNLVKPVDSIPATTSLEDLQAFFEGHDLIVSSGPCP